MQLVDLGHAGCCCAMATCWKHARRGFNKQKGGGRRFSTSLTRRTGCSPFLNVVASFECRCSGAGLGRGRYGAPQLSSAGRSSLGREGSLRVNHLAFQQEDTLPEVNSKFLVINLPDFLPKQFSGSPHSFHAILCNLGFSEAQTQPHNLISWNSFAGTGRGSERCGPQTFASALALGAACCEDPWI